MEELLGQFVLVLDRQIDILKNMVELASKKTDILVSGSIDKIGELIQQEQDARLELERAEKQRCDLMDKIAQLWGFDDGVNTTISNMIDRVSEPFAARLKSRSQQLKEQLDAYKEINQVNHELLESNLNYVNYMINAIMDQQAPSVTYGLDGNMELKKSGYGFFDNKA